MNKTLRIILYTGAFFFFFVFFLYATFPDEVLKNFVLSKIEDALGQQYRIKVNKMSAGLIFGFSFKGVEVTDQSSAQPTVLLKATKVSLNPSLLAILQKNAKFNFDVVVGKGEVSGRYYNSSSESELRLDFDELNLAELGSSGGSSLLSHFQGKLDGKFYTDFYSNNPSKSEGEINLNFVDFGTTAFQVPMSPDMPGSEMEIPAIKLSTGKNSKLIATYAKQDWNIQELTFAGGDLELNLKGKITPGMHIEDYMIDLSGVAKIKGESLQKLPILALLESQREADGSYKLQLSGKLMKPSVTVGTFRLPF